MKILIRISLAVIFLTFTFSLAESLPDDAGKCTKDSDCVKVDIECQNSTAINKKYEKQYVEFMTQGLSGKPEGLGCTNPLKNRVPVCLMEYCTLMEKSVYKQMKNQGS